MATKATKATGAGSGGDTEWQREPSYVEHSDGRYRVDYDWLHEQLTELARLLDIPRTSNKLAQALVMVRRDRALAAADARGASPEERGEIERYWEKRMQRPPSGTINEIAWRRVRPSVETLDDLAELAMREGSAENDRYEWRRRGGCELWSAPPSALDMGDWYARQIAALGDMARRANAAPQTVRRIVATGRTLIEEDAVLQRHEERERRAQPGHRNGTTGAPGE